MLPSPSWHEEEAAAYIRKAMEGYGYFLKEDGHGNMLFYRSTEGEKLMFAAHMDTVDKAVSPAALETEDCFMTDGTTALGADDKCAVAAMLASAAAGPDVLFLFTVAEERGLEGSAMISREFLQPFRIAAAFIFDIEGEVGRVASSAPGKAYIHLSLIFISGLIGSASFVVSVFSQGRCQWQGADALPASRHPDTAPYSYFPQ